MAGWGLQATAIEGGRLPCQYISETRWSFYWAKCIFYYSLGVDQISSVIIWFPYNGRKPSRPLGRQCLKRLLQQVTRQLTTGQKAAYRLFLWSSAVTCRNGSPVARRVYCMEVQSNPAKVREARRPAAAPAPLQRCSLTFSVVLGPSLQMKTQSRDQSVLCSGTRRYSREKKGRAGM